MRSILSASDWCTCTGRPSRTSSASVSSVTLHDLHTVVLSLQWVCLSTDGCEVEFGGDGTCTEANIISVRNVASVVAIDLYPLI